MGKISDRLEENNRQKNTVGKFTKYAIETYKKETIGSFIDILHSNQHLKRDEMESLGIKYLANKWFEEITTKKCIEKYGMSIEVVKIIELMNEETIDTKIKSPGDYCLLKAYDELQIKLLAVDEKKLMENDLKNLNNKLPSKPNKDPFRP